MLPLLAGAGVERIGVVDGDIVEEHNLHRQILHSVHSIGKLKVDSARQRLEALNPLVKVETYPEHLTAQNALKLVSLYDIVGASTTHRASSAKTFRVDAGGRRN